MENDDKALGLDVAIGTIGFGVSNGGIDEFFECFSPKIEDTELDVLIASRFSLIRFAFDTQFVKEQSELLLLTTFEHSVLLDIPVSALSEFDGLMIIDSGRPGFAVAFLIKDFLKLTTQFSPIFPLVSLSLSILPSQLSFIFLIRADITISPLLTIAFSLCNFNEDSEFENLKVGEVSK